MEKSMVHELSSMTHSTIFSSRPSFLFPSDPDRLELRKSRIQNLPGYRKEDLSGKLNFIVVFQTIEIERLSQEIQTLRVMARDWQRQRLNYQNYEVQIRQLTERCHSYELHREGLEDQLEKLKEFCEKLMKQIEENRLKSKDWEPGLKEKYQLERARNEQFQVEVDRWRNRYTSLQVSRAKELQAIRNDFQSRRRSQINRETRELAIKHQNQLATLNSDLRKTRQECSLKVAEISRLQEIIGKFQFREQQMLEIQEKMYDYENKFVLLSQENYRLNELLRRRGEELDRTRKSEKDFKAKLDGNSSLEEQIKRLQVQIQSRRHSYEELERLFKVEHQSNEKLVLQCQKGQKYEHLINQLEVEIQRLNQIMRDKIGECDQLKTTNKLMESKLSASTSATQKEFANYEDKFIAFTRDQERQNAQLKHRLAQNQQLKIRCTEFQKEISLFQNLREENQTLRTQLGQYNNKIEQSKRKIKLLEENLVLMEELEKKLKQEEQSKRDLISDRQKLNNSLRQFTLKNETTNQKALAAQQELSRLTNMEKELASYENRFAWMTQELDRVNGEIQMRVLELQQLKENYRNLGSSKVNYQNIEHRLVQNLAQIEQLVLELDTNRRENDRLQNDNMNMSMTIKGLQGQIINLVDERDDRNRLFNSQTLELQEFRQQFEFFSHQTQVKQVLEQTVQEHSKKIESLKSVLAQKEDRLNMESAQNQSLSLEIMQLRNQPRVSKQLSEELMFLRKQGEDQRMFISVLFQRIETIQNILYLLKQNYLNGLQQMNELKEKSIKLSMNANCIDEIYVIFNSYIQRIVNLQEENLKLESQKGLAGIEYCESMKVVQEGIVTIPQPSIKNSSITYKLTAQQMAYKGSQSDSNLFTFKDMSKEKAINQHDEIAEKAEEEYEESRRSEDARESSSMASSFINTLITKESTNRFQKSSGEANESSAFGYNVNSKLRYQSPPASYEMRYQREQFLPIETQIQNIPTQINRAVSPVNRVSIFQNAGIKRVTSYTHFAPTFNTQVSPTSQGTTPNIRVHQIQRFPSTVNSTSESCLQLGKRIRIPVDPARLLNYRQQ